MADASSATFVWDDALAGYDFGPGHPLAPVRVQLAVRLADELGLLADAGVDRLPAREADAEELRLVHDQEYVDAVRGLSGTAATTPSTCGTGWAPPTTRCSPGCTRRRPASSARRSPRWRAVWSRAQRARGEPGRRPAPRHARPRLRVLRLQRRRGRDRRGRWTHGAEPGRVRRRRRPPRRRGRAGVLGRRRGC